MQTMRLERGWRLAVILLALAAGPVPGQTPVTPPVQGGAAGAAHAVKKPAVKTSDKTADKTADRDKNQAASSPPTSPQQPIPLATQAIISPSSSAVGSRGYFTIRNSSDKPMEIDSITVVDANATRDDLTSGLLPGPATLSCGAPPETPKLPYDIPKFSSCTVTVDLPDKGPGVFEIKVQVQGGQGGQEIVPVKFEVRRSRSWAIGLVMLGLLVGCVVAWWSSTGRSQWQDAARVKAALEAITDLDSDPATPRRLLGLAGGAKDLQGRILAGDAYTPEELAELEQRVRYARAFLITEQRAGASVPVRQAVKAAIELLDPQPDTGLLPPVAVANIQTAIAAIKAAGAGAAGGGAAANAVGALILSPNTSSSSIRRSGAGLEFVVALAVAAVFAAVAMQTLYDGKPHWGSFGDQLAAFLVGFGAFTGSMAGVNAFIAKARTKAV